MKENVTIMEVKFEMYAEKDPIPIGYIAEEYKKDSGPYIMGIDLARGEDEVGYMVEEGDE